MSQPEDIWTTMMHECRKLEYPVLPVFGGEPWLSINYICRHWLQIEDTTNFSKQCRSKDVPIIEVNRRLCARFSDVSAMYLHKKGAAS